MRKAIFAKRLALHPMTDLNDLAKAFLEKQTPSWTSTFSNHRKLQMKDLSFQEILFQAEREKLWDKSTLYLGRSIAQLLIAQQMVEDILENDAIQIRSLLTKLCNLQTHYEKTKSFPKGLVHQDAHPAQFLIHNNALYILDLDDLSYDIAFADIANVYIYKIIKTYYNHHLSKERTIELLNAVLIPDWIGKHGFHILSHNIVSFWNESITLANSYNLENHREINLVVNLKSFLEELSHRENYENTYQDLFPELAF